MYHQWLEQFPTRKYLRNTRLFSQGDELAYCYYLTDGIASQFINYENGTEIVTKYHFPGQMLNIWGVLKHKQICRSSVVSKTDLTAVVIPAAELRRKLDEDFPFYRWVVEHILENNRYIYEQYQKKARGNAAEIVCYTILALCQSDLQGNSYLPREFTFLDLAQHLRIHRITVSHIFKALQEERIVERTDLGWRLLDFDGLNEYAQGNRLLNYSN